MKVGDLVKRIDSSSYGFLFKEGKNRDSEPLAKVWWFGHQGPYWAFISDLEKVE
jgi:hypothetical protein